MSGDLSTRVVTGLSSVLERRFSRRSFVGRTALVGAAVAVGGLDFVLKPTPAYASVCGSGTSCSDGWTAMCCTINDGINQCPPGSFAGGWWKADSAGLCGGTARYYIDCQGECTRCGCNGSSFCTSGCWNCTQHCASGTCDERRVCWNVFRYGQCNQDIGCSGPVLCRMISCVPPWQFADCTTAVATDDNTTDHSAPCLSPWSVIQAYYAAHGGPGSVWGDTVNGEYAVSGGSAQNLTSGRIYTSRYGTFGIPQPLLASYDAHGGLAAIGFPTGEYTVGRSSRGHIQTYSGGGVIALNGSAVYAVLGAIATVYNGIGREGSVIGLPTGNAVAASAGGGSKQVFQAGEIWTNGSQAYALYGPVLQQYLAQGAEQSSFGLPTSSVTVVNGVQTATFQHGSIPGGRVPTRTLNRS